jgi:hypothetical protein
MMSSEVKDTTANPVTVDAPDWGQRTLCSDESCIGVIGSDGRCKECGKAYGGVLPETALQSVSEAPVADTTEVSSEPVEPQDVDEEWEHRRLCSDESCIGVIGADGRCKECGKP